MNKVTDKKQVRVQESNCEPTVNRAKDSKEPARLAAFHSEWRLIKYIKKTKEFSHIRKYLGSYIYRNSAAKDKPPSALCEGPATGRHHSRLKTVWATRTSIVRANYKYVTIDNFTKFIFNLLLPFYLTNTYLNLTLY